MDKVIIDGVDVSECDMRCENKDCALYYAELNNDKGELVYGFNCEDNPNCVYKQLKRKEQENEELKKQYNCYACDSCSGKEDYINMKRHTENAIKTVHKYRQALQEIRELIKKLDVSLGCAYGDYDCDNCSDINEETVCKIKLQNIILAKINEVIGAE